MKVTIVLIVTGAFGTVTKGLLKGLEDLKVGGRMKTIQTTALYSYLIKSCIWPNIVWHLSCVQTNDVLIWIVGNT